MSGSWPPRRNRTAASRQQPLPHRGDRRLAARARAALAGGGRGDDHVVALGVGKGGGRGFEHRVGEEDRRARYGVLDRLPGQVAARRGQHRAGRDVEARQRRAGAGHRALVELRVVRRRGSHVDVAVRQRHDLVLGAHRLAQPGQPGLRGLGGGLHDRVELVQVERAVGSGLGLRRRGLGRRLGRGGARRGVGRRLVLAVLLPDLQVGGQRSGRVAVRQSTYGVDEPRVDDPVHGAVAGAGPEVDERAEPTALGEGLGPAGEVVERAVVGVHELVPQRDHHGRQLLAGPGRGDHREEGAGAAVGRQVPAVRPLTERVHAEPVDAGGVGVEQPARDAQAVRRVVARRQLRDGVLVLLVGDPDADHGVLGRGRCLAELVGGRQRLVGDERVDVDRRPGDGVVVGDRPGDPDHALLGDRRRGQLVDGHRERGVGLGPGALGASAHRLLSRGRRLLLLAQLGLRCRVLARRTARVGVRRSGQQHRDRQRRQGSTERQPAEHA